LDISNIRLAPQLPTDRQERCAQENEPELGENPMQQVMTAITVIAGMALSLAVGVLVEELIFAKLLPLVFIRPVAQIKPVARH
jgi:hypothetical protein